MAITNTFSSFLPVYFQFATYWQLSLLRRACLSVAYSLTANITKQTYNHVVLWRPWPPKQAPIP